MYSNNWFWISLNILGGAAHLQGQRNRIQDRQEILLLKREQILMKEPVFLLMEEEEGGLCRSVPVSHQSGRRAVLTISGNCLGLPIKIYHVIWNFSLHLCQKTHPPSLARLD